MSLRRVRVLLERLPIESSLASELPASDPVTPLRPPRWGHAEWLLADILDALAAANWQRGGGKSKYPPPYPRPRHGPPDPGPMSSLTARQMDELRRRGPGGDRGDATEG